MAIKAEPSFALKDNLFNPRTLAVLSRRLADAYPQFDSTTFEKSAAQRFPTLELKQRIEYLVDLLEVALPEDFDAALAILQRTLPEPLDPSNRDGDFGSFIWVVPGEYAARRGCSATHCDAALTFLREATKRFSAESAIRPFLRDFPEETLAFVADCAIDANYHVRRLASEGIRPFLPWATRVVLPPARVLEVLDLLHADRTRYVTRSVANNLNDLTRIDADAVIDTLAKWRRAKHQDPDELRWMTRHALRSLITKADPRVLELLGYSATPSIRLASPAAPSRVKVGEDYDWRCTLTSTARQRLLIFLVIHFRKANGNTSAKVFKVKDVAVEANEAINLSKRQPFVPRTTRPLYPGPHRAELSINGNTIWSADFELVE